MTPLPYSYVATKVDFLIGYQLHRSGLNPVNQPASMSITQQSTSHIITSPRYFDSNHTLLRLEPHATSTRTTAYFDSNHSPPPTLPYRLKTVLGAGEHPSRTATNPLAPDPPTHRQTEHCLTTAAG